MLRKKKYKNQQFTVSGIAFVYVDNGRLSRYGTKRFPTRSK